MYKTSGKGACSAGSESHSGKVKVKCQGGDYNCFGCNGKLRCNNCANVKVDEGSLEIFAYNISRVYCTSGSEVTINAYSINFAVCKSGCKMILNAYQADMVQCDPGCKATVRVDNGAFFLQTRSWTGCSNKIQHKNFQEFCANVRLAPKEVPEWKTTTMNETAENVTGNYLRLSICCL